MSGLPLFFAVKDRGVRNSGQTPAERETKNRCVAKRNKKTKDFLGEFFADYGNCIIFALAKRDKPERLFLVECTVW